MARTRSDLKQTQLQKDLRIFGLNQLHCALWDKQVFFDSLQFSIAGRGQTLACEEVRRINPRSCLSIISVCCLLHLLPSLFTSGSTVGIFLHALSDQSKSSSQQVKRMLSCDCILVRFCRFGPEQTVWCEKEPNRLK